MADDFILVPVADPLIRTVIGSFVITQLLGRGGMGAVYLAQHIAAAHIRCVFKTILPHLSNNALMIARFNTETQAVARLADHENIVELKDFGVLPNGQMFMQFEYIAGIPLDRFLAEWGGRLSLHRALYLALQVCDALDYAHAAGVVHRDLKPENLLIVIQDHKRVPRLLKIVDFGISKVAGSEVHTISGMKMGTPYYMAVEQYANAAEAGPKADVFSLAVLIWQMVTGELPWGRHPEPGVLYHLQRTVIPTPPPEDIMPAAVARILLRCFSPDPDDRPTMRQLALDLAAVVPATDDAPSGGAILLHIVRRFLMESPELARTMPRSAMANPDDVAAQLWPPANTAPPPPGPVPSMAGASPGAVPSAPVPPPESPPAAPEVNASIIAHASPHALGAPAALSSPELPTPERSPDAAVSVPAAAAPPAPPLGPGSSMPVASPAGAVAWEARGVSWPKIAELPTGLISQRHVAQNPPTDVLATMPRVRSIVAAAELDLANGTPGPEPYAHAEVPRVVVSNTQLSQGEPSPSATPPLGAVAAQHTAHPEPAPVLMLADVARAASRRKLLRVLIAAVGLLLVAGTCFALVRLRSQSSGPFAAAPPPPRADSSHMAAEPSTSDPGHPDKGSAVSRGAINTVGQSMPQLDSFGAHKAHTTGVVTVPMDGSGAVESASSTGAAAPHPSLAPKAPEQSPAARPAGEKPGTLHVEVEPWADVAIDGQRSSTTPVTIKLSPGHHRVVLTKGSSQTLTLDVTIRSNETTTIKRSW